MRATLQIKQTKTSRDPDCQTHSATKEVTGLGRQLTGGKANHTKAVPNSLINNNALAGKLKRNSPSKRPDSNAGVPSSRYIPTGGKADKRRRTNTPNTKGSKFTFNISDSLLELDLWDKKIDDYLGMVAETVCNIPTVILHSDLDQLRSTLSSQMNTQTTITIPTGTSDDPIRLDSSPEKTLETPKTPSKPAQEEIQVP